ncbi:MAG: M20/M25/M40 family metallo-hydrolase [Rhodobacterales bacterium]|nr:M20/M25/M40 family metallo-hydrolase [Rhodobacterales bacterium]
METGKPAQGRDAAITKAREYFESGAYFAELAELVAYPTESQNPARKAELSRYLNTAILPRLEAAGFRCEMFENSDPRGGPFLVAERIEGDGLPTVLSDGHGDVVHGQADQWRAPLRPFELTEDGPRFYGRGAADNKGQHLIKESLNKALISVL